MVFNVVGPFPEPDPVASPLLLVARPAEDRGDAGAPRDTSVVDIVAAAGYAPVIDGHGFDEDGVGARVPGENFQGLALRMSRKGRRRPAHSGSGIPARSRPCCLWRRRNTWMKQRLAILPALRLSRLRHGGGVGTSPNWQTGSRQRRRRPRPARIQAW